MSDANENKPTIRPIDESLDRAGEPDEAIDIEICRFFAWAGVLHGQEDLTKPFILLSEGGSVPELRFTRRDVPFIATVAVPKITGSVEEVAALVNAFAPHMTWGVVGSYAGSKVRPYGFVAPSADDLDPGTGAVVKAGATHAIALLRAFFEIIGRDGFELEAVRSFE